MPRALVDNPSKDTLRKRAQRANDCLKSESKDIKQKNAEYMRQYRAKLREQKKIIEPPPERKSDPVKTLNDIKKEVVNKVSEVIVDVFQDSKENKRTAIEELKNSMPEIKHEIKAIADETKIKITKDMKIELLTDLLFEHTKD
jgi:phenylpyruvate tautomerase PptA (4-oxalocrotonate tautomerase family)